MLAAFVAWRSATRHELTEVGTEVDVEGVVAAPGGELPGVRVRGRVDRLERDPEGRLVVVDVKTGKSPVTRTMPSATPSSGSTSWPSPKGCSATARSPAAGGWCTSANRPPPAPPNASSPR